MKDKSTQNPFTNLVLDPEEQELEEALANNQFEENSDFSQIQEMLQQAATNYKHLNKTRPVTLRIYQLDLIKVKAKAKENNIPYQTLLSTLIHQYAQDKKNIVL